MWKRCPVLNKLPPTLNVLKCHVVFSFFNFFLSYSKSQGKPCLWFSFFWFWNFDQEKFQYHQICLFPSVLETYGILDYGILDQSTNFENLESIHLLSNYLTDYFPNTGISTWRFCSTLYYFEQTGRVMDDFVKKLL